MFFISCLATILLECIINNEYAIHGVKNMYLFKSFLILNVRNLVKVWLWFKRATNAQRNNTPRLMTLYMKFNVNGPIETDKTVHFMVNRIILYC